MTRYSFSQPRRPKLSRWAEDVPYLPELEVLDTGPVDTGLVTPDGRKIWAMPEPIGFPLVGDSDNGGHE